MITVQVGRVRVGLEESTLQMKIEAAGTVWSTQKDWTPYLLLQDGRQLAFTEGRKIEHEVIKNGVGAGILSSYEGYEGAEHFAFKTLIWVEEANESLHMEWIPICEEGVKGKEVHWPAALHAELPMEGEGYTLLNSGQGLLLPDTWPVELNQLHFNGTFLTAGSYMPWFGQVKGKSGYLAIAETPWDAGVEVRHPAGGPSTEVRTRWDASLGSMRERRCLLYRFFEDCDYNKLCKAYRSYVKEIGHFCSLKEKAARVPSVEKLIGCSFVHFGIKTHVNPASDFFDSEAPDKNNRLTSFEQRRQTIEEIHRLGVENMYLHLDGWAEPGYDNKHPDYSPACEEAGGWEGMRKLADTLHEYGYLFGIHDQYRDYYLDAPSFDEAYAVQLADGSMPTHKRWAGGPQSYLCSSQAPYYVRRNFKKIKENGIDLDCAYLDVFTCNEGDECDNPMHRITRRESYEYRGRCFAWLLAQGILSSSEEVSDWSIRNLVFCHYAPYTFMLQAPNTPKNGIPVPLFNLVYHDCVIEPWMMDKNSETEDLMLYALLNGGAPYLIREGAYANTDGSFESEYQFSLAEQAERCAIVAKLHEKVAEQEMLRHELLTADGSRQRTVFADGTKVTVDFIKNTYEIS
ncbi:MAG: DUF5696 domain-containing protein [bacterium]|nr:DUF5696 domain-containing protein [bacterium]